MIIQMKPSRLALALLFVSILYTFKITVAQNSPADFVNAHNAARRSVGVGPVRWNTTLASYARNYANRQTGDCLPLKHSGGPYGENLFWGRGRNYSAKDAVDSWVSERQFYNYNTNSCAAGRQCGHYTQVVWAKSTMIGCERRMCDGGSYYIICEYFPRGNIRGQRPY